MKKHCITYGQRRRFALPFFAAAFFLLSASPALADEISVDTAVWLDRDTVAHKGYSVQSSHKDMLLGIAPGIFSEASLVEIKNADTDNTTVPDGYRLISNTYVYNISMTNPVVTERPLWVRLRFDSDSTFRKRPYFWDRTTQRWIEVPGRVDMEARTFVFALHFPYTQVAIFEDTHRLDIPRNVHGIGAPSVDADMAIVVDNRTGLVLYEKDADKAWWPASLTKLMTAMVFLDTHPDMNKIVAYDAADHAIGSRLRVRPGETMRVRDLFYTMLVGSANNAANTLVRTSSLTQAEFLAAMNAKAKALGMENTAFADFSGLSTDNKSTARDIAKMVANASRYWDIYIAANTQRYDFTTHNTGVPHTIRTTNKVSTRQLALVKKTGYLDESGYNYATHLRDSPGNEFTIVVLGASSARARFADAQKLAQWVGDHWEWE